MINVKTSWDVLLEEAVDKGVKESEKKSKAAADKDMSVKISNLMKNLDMSADDVMNAMGIPEDKREVYRKLII